MEGFLADLLSEPEITERLLSRMADFFFQRTVMILQAAQGCLDGIGLYNDLGTQDGMMISPALYRQFVKPKQKRLIEMAKSYGVRVFYHSCGAIEAVYDDLIEIGVDIIDPLQMGAMRVTPEHLQAAYADRVTLHGGLDVQKMLPWATPSEVAAEVNHLLGTLGAKGGYILAGSHFYQIDIPLANIEAIHSALH